MADYTLQLLLLLVVGWVPYSTLSLPLPTQIVSIYRTPTLPDIIRPSICPSSCKDLFHALDTEVEDSPCACVCPMERPVFLMTDGFCVNKLAECTVSLSFSSVRPGDNPLPTFNLPAKGGIVNPHAKILWKASGLSNHLSCSVSAIFSDNANHRWKEMREGLFVVNNSSGNRIMFNGTQRESALLEGSVVQIKMICGEVKDVCIGFRIQGITESSNRVVITGSDSRTELVILIILAVLLILTLFGSFLIWNICWKMKKEKLISDIQMQFLVHFKQQQEDARNAAMAAMASHAPSSPSAVSHHSMLSHSPSEFTPPSTPQQMERHNGAQKRRLYFSTEFLEPHMMYNPPPVAEQFLFDLRRMIDMAKERIQMRRHVPQLMCILEEEEEIYQSFMKPRVITPLQKRVESVDNDTVQDTAQDSPRSGKSVDSGHETLESSESGESKDSEESSGDEERVKETENGTKESVRQLVKGFESQQSRTPPTSRIPTLSPRIPPRSLTLSNRDTTQVSSSSLPPRPLMSPTNLPISPPSTQVSAIRRTKNKGYAVFPVDPMLKKSLPRRPKREIPRLVKDN